MRIMKNLRNYFLAILIIGVGIAAIACSSDDEPKKDETVFDNDPPQHFDGLTVTYQLLNKDSIPMKSFKQGEDIIFSLIIKNNRDTTVSLPLIDSIGINVPPVSERNVPPSAERNVPLVSD